MKLDPKCLLQLQKMTPMHRGVFSAQDLASLFLSSGPLSLGRKLKPFLKAGLLSRFCRGYYVAKDFDLAWLSQRLSPESALSFGTVLAKSRLIGNIPQKTVYAVKIGKTRKYASLSGNIVHFGFSTPAVGNCLWFGYDQWTEGIRSADNEKAFLDTLYFYQSGNKFSFNVYSDIAVDRLNRKKLTTYLSRYKNPKFVAFVKGVLRGYDSI